jgi:hypothetical protein
MFKIKDIIKLNIMVFLSVQVLTVQMIPGPGRSYGTEATTYSETAASKKGNPFHEMRDYVLSYFTPVSGTIIDVEGGRVRIKVDTERELKKGMRFSVFRKGRPFYHPVTGEEIGSSEVLMGRIEVAETGSRITSSTNEVAYLCRIVQGSPETGDIVRISSSRVKLAFFQTRDADWSMSDSFYNLLKDSGRFELVEAYTKDHDPEVLSRLAENLGAEAVVIFSTPSKDDRIFLHAKLIWSGDVSVFGEIERSPGLDYIKDLSFGEDLISIGSVDKEPWGIHMLDGGEFIAMGDVDGNGEKEMIISDGNNIRIYSFLDKPREMWLIRGDKLDKHISLDVLDINGNGRAEILVTSVSDMGFDADLSDSKMMKRKNKKKMASFVIEYDAAGTFRRIWDDVPYIIRVSGNKLLMQAVASNMKLSGPVYQGVWKDGKYLEDKPLNLPPGVDIFGFTFVDWQNSGHKNVLAFDELGYLSIYDGNDLIWKGKQSFGTFSTSIDGRGYSVTDPDEEWIVKGRIFTVKTEQGLEAVVVKKIPYVKKLSRFGSRKAEVYSLRWDGEAMTETLLAEEVPISVTDYWVEKGMLLLLGRPNMFTLLKRSLSGEFKKGSMLYHYQIAGE